MVLSPSSWFTQGAVPEERQVSASYHTKGSALPPTASRWAATRKKQRRGSANQLKTKFTSESTNAPSTAHAKLSTLSESANPGSNAEEKPVDHEREEAKRHQRHWQ